MGDTSGEHKTDPAPVLVTVEDSVCEIRLNRPDKRNALNDATFAALGRAFRGVPELPDVRAVVFSAAPPVFCAGLDLSLFQAFADEAARGHRPFAAPGDRASGQRDPAFGQRIVSAMRALAVPVIAAVEGPAIGGGLQLALGADIRILGPAAVLAAREIRYGITLDMGGTQLLARLIGEDRAMELVLTGRDVSAEEAYRMGLATLLADDARASAFELARSIAGANPDAVRASKTLILQAGDRPIAEGFADELTVMASNIGQPNQVEAVQAHFSKRTPRFLNNAASTQQGN